MQSVKNSFCIAFVPWSVERGGFVQYGMHSRLYAQYNTADFESELFRACQIILYLLELLCSCQERIHFWDLIIFALNIDINFHEILYNTKEKIIKIIKYRNIWKAWFRKAFLFTYLIKGIIEDDQI